MPNTKKPSRPQAKIKIVSVIDDEASKSFFVKIAFTDIDGKRRTTITPMASLEDPDRLGETLKNLGADINLQHDDDRCLLEGLNGQAKGARRACFSQAVGWHSSNRVFVMPTRVIGNRTDKKAILPPRTPVSEHNRTKPQTGSRKAWSNTVGNSAQYSSRAVAAICAALAAPLLKHVSLPSFAIHTYGKSRAGKSTALLAGASVTGFRQEGDLPNFRGTDVALEEMPASFNDMFLPINELGLLRGTPAQRAEIMHGLAYGIAENRGKALSLKVRPEHDRAKAAWSCIAMTNGEESADEIAMEVGAIRREGELFRWIDLCAVRGSGSDIFDMAPETVTDKKRAAWVSKQCKIIRNGARRNAGSVGDFFIRKLIKRRKTIGKEIRVLMAEFEARHHSDNAIVRHIAKNFALLYAAGTFAIRVKAVKWHEDIVRDSIDRCFRDAVKRLPTEERLLRIGLIDLRRKMRSAAVLDLRRVKSPGREAFGKCVGFIEKQDGRSTLTIAGNAFKSCFRDPRSAPIVLHWLAKSGTGIKSPPSKTGKSITWAESQSEWPDGRRPRSIVFRCPKKLLKK